MKKVKSQVFRCIEFFVFPVKKHALYSVFYFFCTKIEKVKNKI